MTGPFQGHTGMYTDIKDNNRESHTHIIKKWNLINENDMVDFKNSPRINSPASQMVRLMIMHFLL